MEILEARILSPHPCSKIKDKRNLTKIWNAHQIVVLQCPWCIRRFKSLNKLPTTIGFVGGKQIKLKKKKTGCIRIVLQGLRHGAIQKDAIWEETCRSLKVQYPVLKIRTGIPLCHLSNTKDCLSQFCLFPLSFDWLLTFITPLPQASMVMDHLLETRAPQINKQNISALISVLSARLPFRFNASL